MISQRPAEWRPIAPCPGHWEGDLILGLEEFGDRHLGGAHELALHSAAIPCRAWRAMATRLARRTGPHSPVIGAEAVRDAITRTIVTLPEQLRRSLTWDQGG